MVFMEAPPIIEKKETVVRCGSDQVTIADTEIIIETKHAMADWKVHEFNPVPVYFGERKCILTGKFKAQPPFAIRYVLKPWPAGQHTNSVQFHTYDIETVKERDAHRRRGLRDELIRCCLLLFYPLLGLLWSGAQRWLGRFGIIARSITGVSIFTVFCLLFGQGVFAVVMLNASLRSGRMMIGGYVRALAGTDRLHLGPIGIPLMPLDILLAVALLADVLIRYTRYLRDDEWTGGFLEWLVPKKFRKSENHVA